MLDFVFKLYWDFYTQTWAHVALFVSLMTILGWALYEVS